MSKPEVLTKLKDRVLTVTLNRPEMMNTWSPEMEGELREAVGNGSADKKVRVIVITGAGKAFCAGGSIRNRQHERKDVQEAEGPSSGSNYPHRHSYFADVPKPIIAMINGATAGIGLIYAIHCDLRFASETANFSTAFARRGILAESGLAWSMASLIGRAKALDLLLSARKFSGREAEQLGLVNRAVPSSDLQSFTYTYAQDLATYCSPMSMAIIKKQIYDAPFQSFAEAAAFADAQMPSIRQSLDYIEGRASFVQKRLPRFTDF